jgi:hypothetical protein
VYGYNSHGIAGYLLCGGSVWGKRLQHLYSRKPRLPSLHSLENGMIYGRCLLHTEIMVHTALGLSLETVFTPVDFKRVSLWMGRSNECSYVDINANLPLNLSDRFEIDYVLRNVCQIL